MGIVNRTKDSSEQKESLKLNVGPVATGADVVIGPIERACTITDMKVSCIGMSNTAHVFLKGLRFIAGTGGSSFAIGSSFALSAFGTSGYLSYSLPASGSTLLNLQKGDVLALQVGGSNAAVTGLAVDVVVQNIQDIITWY